MDSGVLFGDSLARLMDCAFDNVRGASVHPAVTPQVCGCVKAPSRILQNAAVKNSSDANILLPLRIIFVERVPI